MSDTIRRFRPDEMAQTAVVLVLGRRFSGKSILMKDLMYRFRDKVDKGIIFSGTEHASPFYSEFFPDIFIHKKYDHEKIERIINKQCKVTKNMHKENRSKLATAKSTMFVLMDDCLADANWKNDETMKEIFFNGRHYHLLFFLATQYPMSVPAHFRANADYTFIYSDKDVRNRRRIHENYCGMVPYADFLTLMDEVCHDFRCLVIDNRKKDLADWRDIVFWYKAEPRMSFRFGSDALWRYHEKYIRDSDDEEEADRYWKTVANMYGDENAVHKFRMVE